MFVCVFVLSVCPFNFHDFLLHGLQDSYVWNYDSLEASHIHNKKLTTPSLLFELLVHFRFGGSKYLRLVMLHRIVASGVLGLSRAPSVGTVSNE